MDFGRGRRARCGPCWRASSAPGSKPPGRGITWSCIPPVNAAAGPSSSRNCIARSCNTSRSVAFPCRRPGFRWSRWCFPRETSFLRHAVRQGVSLPGGTLGYYSRQTNRILLYDLAADGGAARLENAATIVHEATHQMAFNTGVHAQLRRGAGLGRRGIGDAVRGAGRVRLAAAYDAREPRNPRPARSLPPLRAAAKNRRVIGGNDLRGPALSVESRCGLRAGLGTHRLSLGAASEAIRRLPGEDRRPRRSPIIPRPNA